MLDTFEEKRLVGLKARLSAKEIVDMKALKLGPVRETYVREHV